MGRKMFRTLMVALCLLALAAVNASAATSRSAVGTWKLDVSKSSYGNMPAPKFEKLVVTTDKPGAVKWILTGASADGKTYVSMYDGPIDGNDRPFGDSTAGNNIAYTRTASGFNRGDCARCEGGRAVLSRQLLVVAAPRASQERFSDDGFGSL